MREMIVSQKKLEKMRREEGLKENNVTLSCRQAKAA